MTVLDVTLGGLSYRVACDIGEEERLLQLSAEMNRRVEKVVRQVAGAGETMRLVMAGLMMAEELRDLRRELDALRENAPDGAASSASGAPTKGQTQEAGAKESEMDESAAHEALVQAKREHAETLRVITARLEALAGALEPSAGQT